FDLLKYHFQDLLLSFKNLEKLPRVVKQQAGHADLRIEIIGGRMNLSQLIVHRTTQGRFAKIDNVTKAHGNSPAISQNLLADHHFVPYAAPCMAASGFLPGRFRSEEHT